VLFESGDCVRKPVRLIEKLDAQDRCPTSDQCAAAAQRKMGSTDSIDLFHHRHLVACSSGIRPTSVQPSRRRQLHYGKTTWQIFNKPWLGQTPLQHSDYLRSSEVVRNAQNDEPPYCSGG
jgi:hypothetical protein